MRVAIKLPAITVIENQRVSTLQRAEAGVSTRVVDLSVGEQTRVRA